MKIAMLGQKGLPAIWGGVERHVEELSTRLTRQGHEVTVYCRRWYSTRKLPKHQGVILRFVPSIHTKHLDAITHTFLATINALFHDFDIIHYHGVGPALLSWIPRLFKPSAKVVVTFHCPDRLHGKWGALAKLILHLGEWCACHFPHQTIVVSQTLKEYVEKQYHCQTIYIPNGVKTPATAQGESLIKFNLEKNKYLLTVSRLVSHKATHCLIEAFRRLKKKHSSLAKGLKLVIVGEGSFTDAYVNYLHQMAANSPEAVFTGWQSGENLADLFAHALLFIHPSQSEGLPLSVLEAIGYGRPVVASDIPEHQEIITDKRFLFRQGQVADLEKKIIWALKNPEILKVAGLQNRKLAEKDYNWDEIAELTESIYQQLVFSPADNSADNLPAFTVKYLEAK